MHTLIYDYFHCKLYFDDHIFIVCMFINLLKKKKEDKSYEISSICVQFFSLHGAKKCTFGGIII